MHLYREIQEKSYFEEKLYNIHDFRRLSPQIEIFAYFQQNIQKQMVIDLHLNVIFCFQPFVI